MRRMLLSYSATALLTSVSAVTEDKRAVTLLKKVLRIGRILLTNAVHYLLQRITV